MKQLKVKLSWLKTTEALNDAECGRLIRGMLQYASSGEAPELKGNERMMWPAIQEDLDNQRGAFTRQSKTNRQNVTNRYESLRIVTNRYESLKGESTPPIPPGKESPIPLKKTSPKGEVKERSLSPAMADAVEAFKEMRQKSRAPLTDRALDMILNKVEKLAPGNEHRQIEILMQSVENGWRGVWDLREERQKGRERNTLKNYQEQGVSHANLTDIALDMEEL